MYATWNGEVINTVHRWSTCQPFSSTNDHVDPFSELFNIAERKVWR